MKNFGANAEALGEALRAALDGKAKPIGALGRIEDLAIQIGLIAGSLKPDLGRAALIVFAGDHGLTAESVTAYPSEVTALVAQIILDGQAGANIAARAAGADVILVDAGMKTPLAAPPAEIVGAPALPEMFAASSCSSVLKPQPPALTAQAAPHKGAAQALAAEVPDLKIAAPEAKPDALRRAALIERRIGASTANSAREPAMSPAHAQTALEAGAALAQDFARRGYGIFALGEIGIGNSSAASLLAHAVTGLPLEILTGPGAGAPPGGVAHKLAVLRKVAARGFPALTPPPLPALVGEGEVAQPAPCPSAAAGQERISDAHATAENAMRAIAQCAGFEMAMLTGAILGAAQAGKLVLIDGFIATACAAASFAIEPAAKANCVFAHRSAEPGHDALLAFLGERPLLDLGMRLGEGTGAALAIPLVRMAESLLRDMADLPGAHPG